VRQSRRSVLQILLSAIMFYVNGTYTGIISVYMTDEEKVKSSTWLTEGILIAGFSALVYLYTFNYESGYLGAFGVPKDFVEINLNTIMIVAVALLSFFVSLGLIFQGLLIMMPKKYGPVGRSLISLSPVFIFFLIQLIAYGLRWEKWIFSLAILLFISFKEFVFPLISQREKKSYKEKLEAQEEKDVEVRSKSLLSSAIEFIGRKYILAFGILLMMFLISSTVGESEALRKTNFIVARISPEAVVLRIYGDKLICAPFYRETKETEKSFFILNKADISKISFRIEKIGPLYPKTD
jgi:hypothetical protein